VRLSRQEDAALTDLANRNGVTRSDIMRKALNGLKPDEATDKILDMFSRTRNNYEFVNMVKKNKFI
jgi:transcription termination factor Rho